MTSSDPRRAAKAVLSALPVIMRTVGRSMREGGGDVSPQQHRILSMLSRKPRTLSEIARIQGVRPATATTMVTTLEHRGLVRRDVDPDDRRRVVVSMTQVGHTAFDAAQEVAERALAELLAPLGLEELASLAEGSEAVRRLGSSESAARL